ncbi:VOC family protein [Enterococcus gallinarum]|uniref:VOC family protein n=1 Tax=Enterococcus gallinarum TaxID=1353 RepID=UPI001D17CB26|nr:VOC family protein [Enterococcus gallinarum]MCC4046131.1 VOC family protein [Enterococcus gallinarum]
MTVIIPEFQLHEQTQIGKVVLKVANLEKMIAFYTQVIGLSLIEKNQQTARLGTTEKILLELIKVENPLPLTRKTGLFHVAFLLPTRKDLGNTLIHYLQSNAPIDGASDHGYSEALYLTDPEGNGIEVYRDKPKSEWDIREDGEIVGITKEMDAEGVVAAADSQQSSFPTGTIVGHVHLKVADLAQTETFYTQVVGLSLKNNFGNQAKFFAAGDYHHHIGSNTWMGKGVPPMADNDLGLAYYTFVLPDKEAFESLLTHLEKKNVSFTLESSRRLALLDPNGIQVKMEY